MTTIGYIVLIAAVTAAVAVIVWDHRKSRRLLNRLDEMLDKAITQGFTEEDYDESLLSAVENKLARYLAASDVRKSADELLPGYTIRYGLFYRFLLKWVKR